MTASARITVASLRADLDNAKSHGVGRLAGDAVVGDGDRQDQPPDLRD
jgi:hypothetical protein